MKLVAAVLVCATCLPGILSASDDVWIGRAGAGFAGEVVSVGVVGAGVLGLYMASHLNFNDETSWGPAALGLLILVPGMPAATAGGVCIAGHAQDLDGRYWAAYLGGLAGLPLGFGVVCLGTLALSLSPYVAVPVYIAGAVAPAVGATIGYDLSRSHGVESDVWRERLVPPAVAIVPMHRVGHERTTRIDARLLSVRF